MILRTLEFVLVLPVVAFVTWLWIGRVNQLSGKQVAAGFLYVALYFGIFHFWLKQF
jgi:hypothetical protein